jgi:hypothetical protein
MGQNLNYHQYSNNPQMSQNMRMTDFQRRYTPSNFDSSPPNKRNRKDWY